MIPPKIYRFIHTHELFFFVALIVTVLRLPNLFEPYWYGDEGIYLAVGHAMRQGAPLYTGIVDHKTPLIYVWAALADSLIWFKVLLLLFSLISLGLFYALCRRWFHTPRTVMVPTVIFAALTTLPWLEANIVNGELMLMPFILAGVWWFWRRFSPKTIPASWSLPVVIGMWYSLALLTKVPAGFDFAALGVFWLFIAGMYLQKSLIGAWFRFGCLLVVGFALPILVSVLYFWATGHLSDYLNSGLLYNFRYIASWGNPFTHPLFIFLSSLKGRLLTLGVYVGALWLIRRRLRLPAAFTLIWYGFALFAAMLSLRPYPHYFIQIVPPLALMLGFVFTESRTYKIFSSSTLLLSLVIFIGFGFKPYPTLRYYVDFLRYMTHQTTQAEYYRTLDPKTDAIYAAAGWLKTHTLPTERFFIWGDEPMVYALSRRSPVGRFMVGFHIMSFGAYDETMTALEQGKPRYILDYFHYPPAFSRLYDFIGRHYTPVTTIGGATVYRRLPSF